MKSRIDLRVENVRVMRLKSDRNQMRRLVRGIRWARERWQHTEGRELRDEDLIDAIISTLHHEFGA